MPALLGKTALPLQSWAAAPRCPRPRGGRQLRAPPPAAGLFGPSEVELKLRLRVEELESQKADLLALSAKEALLAKDARHARKEAEKTAEGYLARLKTGA